MNCCDDDKPKLPPPEKIVTVAAGVLIDRDGRVLLAERPAGKAMAGLFEFPGGKIETGETPEMALVRELREELGIETCEGCFHPLTFVSHRYEDFHLVMMVLTCRVWKGAAVGKEGQKLIWVYPRDLEKHQMPPADLPLIPILKDL